jgi:hypothetical protein
MRVFQAITRSRRIIVPALAIISVTLLIPLVSQAMVGTHSRYLADDYCTAGDMRVNGFVQSQTDMYMNWSGRFSFTFLVNIVHLFGPRLVPLLPAASILSLLLAQLLLWRNFTAQSRKPLAMLSAFTISAAVVLFVLGGVPSIYQSLYWLTGMLTYFMPLILLSFLLASHMRSTIHKPGALPIVAAAALSFFAGGFSETYVVIQTAILSLLLVLNLMRIREVKDSLQLPLVLSGLLGSAGAGLVILIAPGNAMRQALMTAPAALDQVLRNSLWDAIIYSNRILRSETLSLFLILAIPMMVSAIRSTGETHRTQWPVKRLLIALLVTPFLTYFLVALTFAPSEYAISSYPDARVLITTQFILGLGLAAWGWLLGMLWRLVGNRVAPIRWQGATTAILLPLGLAIGALAMRTELTDSRAMLSKMQGFSQTWDVRDATIRQAATEGVTELRARSLTHMDGLAELERDPDEWINRCIAQYYGLESIVAK